MIKTKESSQLFELYQMCNTSHISAIKLTKLDQASETEIDDLRKQNKQLLKQYGDLETEYTLKIESLELKIKEVKHQLKLRRDDSTSKCEDLEDELKKTYFNKLFAEGCISIDLILIV